MTQSTQQAEIEALEDAFWQSIADNDPDVAIAMLTEPAVMVSGHGAMQFDHAAYRKMSNDGRHKLVSYTLSKREVFFAAEDVAIATYHAQQKMEMDGKPMELRACFSSTWVKVGGQWKCAAHTECTETPKG
jgi:uncharacterized protein (TIGR02246 family)